MKDRDISFTIWAEFEACAETGEDAYYVNEITPPIPCRINFGSVKEALLWLQNSGFNVDKYTLAKAEMYESFAREAIEEQIPAEEE